MFPRMGGNTQERGFQPIDTHLLLLRHLRPLRQDLQSIALVQHSYCYWPTCSNEGSPSPNFKLMVTQISSDERSRADLRISWFWSDLACPTPVPLVDSLGAGLWRMQGVFNIPDAAEAVWSVSSAAQPLVPSITVPGLLREVRKPSRAHEDIGNVLCNLHYTPGFSGENAGETPVSAACKSGPCRRKPAPVSQRSPTPPFNMGPLLGHDGALGWQAQSRGPGHVPLPRPCCWPLYFIHGATDFRSVGRPSPRAGYGGRLILVD